MANQFVRVGHCVINLAQVAEMVRTEHNRNNFTGDLVPCVAIWFSGYANPARVYQDEGGYAELVAWMDKVASI